MRRIELEQGSEDWLKWRKGRITATEAAELVGVSPYCTPFKSWQRKLGLIPPQEETEPMRRGKRDEPIARELFCKATGINMNPCCVESDMYPFIGSSLDGISDCGKYILEIKSQKPVDSIPELHGHQIQHQFLSCDNTIEKCFYVSFWDGEITIFEAFKDRDWQKMYLPKAKEHWKKIIFEEPPVLMQSDYRDMTGKLDWEINKSIYMDLDAEIKELEIRKDEYRKKLIDICEGQSSKGGGLRIMNVTTKGRINYEGIPELEGIDLEKHRKPSSNSWKFMLDS